MTIFGAALVVVSAALIGLLAYPSLAVSPSATSSKPIALRSYDSPRRDHQRAPDQPGVVVPDGTTVFDEDVPAVANLDPRLLRALRRAATNAGGDGVKIYVISGWRSRKDQERMFREAVSKYGSKEEAARWVALPGTSAHESGNAVDLVHSDAILWLSKYGATYGLCQIYSNKPWHYELRPDAVHHGCPPLYGDPDPGSTDAAMTSTVGIERASTRSPTLSRTRSANFSKNPEGAEREHDRELSVLNSGSSG